MGRLRSGEALARVTIAALRIVHEYFNWVSYAYHPVGSVDTVVRGAGPGGPAPLA